MRWVRGPSLRARLTRALTGLGLVSVVLLALVNFVVVRDLLASSSEDQLGTLREVRTDQIDGGFTRLLQRVSALGADPGLSTALSALADGYRAFDEDVTPDDVDALEAVYADVTAAYEEAGAEVPPTSQLLPGSVAGRQLQRLYVADQPADDRRSVVDAGDGSAYSEAHARFHPYLVALSDSFGGADLLLVAADSADVVYSVDKRIDLGTDVARGPHAESGLGAVWDQLRLAAAGDAVLNDMTFHLPASGTPLVHAGTVVRDGTEVVGAVMVAIEIDVLTGIVSSGGRWELLGLGETGDAYLVGSDRRLRTVPRTWSEEPARALERFAAAGGDEREVELIDFIGSPVLVAQVDNVAVARAVEGERHTATVTNATGDRVRAATGPLSVRGLDWVVVTEVGVEASRAEQLRFLGAIGILIAVLLPLLSVVGLALARLFARPVDPLVAAARRIADGDYDTPVPDLGRNELGDLGQQLAAIAGQLREQDAAIAIEETRITTLLASVLPDDLVEPVRRGEVDVGDMVDLGTVVALSIGGLPDVSGSAQDDLLEVTERLSVEARSVAAAHGVERARVAADQQLFVAGRGTPDSGAARAVAFALDAVDHITAVGREFGLPVTAHVGLASGWVASGVLGSQQISFGVWGDAVNRSIDLSTTAGPDQVLADESVVDEHPDDELYGPAVAGDRSGRAAHTVERPAGQ